MNITVKDMLDLNPDRYQILDIRSKEQMASGRIPGAIHADKDHILETPGLDQEKQQIANEIQRDLNQEEQSTMQPILSDIMKAIQRVRQQKGLDIVLEQGAVVDGGIDITSEVSQQLAK